MGKHPKDKKNGARKAGGAAAPYPKKAQVEVKFEGDKSSKSAKSLKATKPKPKADKAKAPAPSKPAAQPAKDKGKGKALPEVETDAPVPSKFLVVAGSYEKLLYGLEGSYEAGESKPTLKPIFIFPAHLACVKAVAASPGGKWLASGSEDEFVKVWDLRRRKEVGSLSQHTGEFVVLDLYPGNWLKDRVHYVAALPHALTSRDYI